MPPYLSDHFRSIDPAYREGYEAGYEAAKHMAALQLKEALKVVQKTPAFQTSTATTALT